METLAFIYTAVAYEDPSPDAELRSLNELNFKASGSVALGLLSAGVVTSTLSHADQAQALILRGDIGSGVAQVQRKLGISDDGVFGSQTFSSVYDYQVRNRLRFRDGKAGPETLTSLGLPPYLSSGGPSSSNPDGPNVGTRAYVTAYSGLLIRNNPDGAVVGSLRDGASVRLTGFTQNAGGLNWSELTSGNWVASRHLSIGVSNPNGDRLPVPTGAFVNARIGLLVRNAPAGSQIGGLNYLAPVRLSGDVRSASGRSWSQLSSGGWVASEYVTIR